MSQPPRLALILTEFPPAFGGMQTHAEALAAHLLQRGWSLVVYTYRPDLPEQQAAAAQFDAGCGYPVHRVLSRIGFWHNLRLLQRELGRQAPALIYAANVYYGLLGERLGVPVICRSVGNDVQRPWIAYPYRLGSGIVSHPRLEGPLHRLYRRCNTPEWLEALLRRARQQLMRRSARANRLLLANSDYTRELLLATGADAPRIRVVPGGVDCARFATASPALRATLGLPQDAVILLTACRLVAKKGIDFLIAQLPALRTVEPRLHLLVVGDGRERRRCEQQVSALHLDHAVTFAGRVPQHAIQHYFAACDVFILASRISVNRISGLADAETMGRVLCEANAAGVPVLASRSGGIPSVIRDDDNGLLFASDDAEDLLRQFRRLRTDPALAARLVARGRQRAQEEFDWRVILAAHEQAFASVLQSSRPSPATLLAASAAS
ncbi:glycosyltransferase family 4 protein [Chitinilyticum piscinae]|uniref:Glycosyltransferase family 4 protein n=1 Tax=Chitinilyticum piscinae TaxID=2866724 RepID=A0A8J7KEA3_9NEIS|nr:glycosyltransferase family 4 protein [Chitinilyticum piscinae]MBE9609279.1 glycosyltransferase family 4 protein [Chitinilyticum piscinae]